MIEPLQVRQRHAHVAYRRGAMREIQRSRDQASRLAADTQQNGFHIETRLAATALDGPLHLVQRMVQEQVQDTDKVFDSLSRPLLALQRAPQLVEHRRQLPMPKDVGMVQCRRPPLEGFQVMPRIEDLLVLAVTAGVRCDHLAAMYDLDMLDIGFDRDDLEGGGARHAIAVRIVAHHLVLVGLGGLHHAGIEGVFRKGQCLVTLARKALANGLGLLCLDALAVTQTARAQVDVQGSQVAGLRHRCGPVALQVADAALDVPLLLRPANQTEQRREGIVADQRLVAIVQPSLAARE